MRSRSGNPDQEQEPGPEPGRPWVSERNAWTWHNLGIPSLSREIVAETDAVMGCSEYFEGVSAGSVSCLGRQTRLRNRLRLGAPAPKMRSTEQS